MKTLFVFVSLLLASLSFASNCGSYAPRVTLFTVDSAGMLNLDAAVVGTGQRDCNYYGGTVSYFSGPVYISGINTLFLSSDGQSMRFIQDSLATHWEAMFPFPVGAGSAFASGFFTAARDVRTEIWDSINGGTSVTYSVQRTPIDFAVMATHLPEPSEYLLLLVGLGMMGFVARRKEMK